MPMTRGDPLVSVGMPVRNSEATIALAIASIVAQSYTNWELIVMDDGSTDRSLEIAHAFEDARIRVISDGEHKGIPARRAEIVRMSSGAYLAWMDSDDIAYPSRLRVEEEFLETHSSIDLVTAAMIVFRDDGEAIGKRSVPADHTTICRRPYSGFPMFQPTFMGRRSWFLNFGYDTNLNPAARHEDQDLLLRAYRESKYAGIQQILVGYRENKIDLRKTLVGRRFWLGSIMRDAKRNSHIPAGIAAVILQVAKAAADVIAVKTGLNYLLLRHRAEPLTAAERDEFRSVYEAIGDVVRSSSVDRRRLENRQHARTSANAESAITAELP